MDALVCPQSAGASEPQVESTTRRKLELLLREQARDQEGTDGCTVRALLRATREGLDAHLKQERQVRPFAWTQRQLPRLPLMSPSDPMGPRLSRHSGWPLTMPLWLPTLSTAQLV